jgi:hypothetical protein
LDCYDKQQTCCRADTAILVEPSRRCCGGECGYRANACGPRAGRAKTSPGFEQHFRYAHLG